MKKKVSCVERKGSKGYCFPENLNFGEREREKEKVRERLLLWEFGIL